MGMRVQDRIGRQDEMNHIVLKYAKRRGGWVPGGRPPFFNDSVGQRRCNVECGKPGVQAKMPSRAKKTATRVREALTNVTTPHRSPSSTEESAPSTVHRPALRVD